MDSLLLQIAGGQDALMSFLPLIGIGLVAYFLLFMPQKKKEKEMKKKLDAMEKGDKVVSIGGIVGVVSHINKDSDEVTIKTGDDTKLVFKKRAIAEVTPKHSEVENSAKESKEADK